MSMHRIIHFLLHLKIRSLTLIKTVGTTEVADVPFLLASCIHRMVAWYKLDGARLEAKFCDAVERFGFSSPQALEVGKRSTNPTVAFSRFLIAHRSRTTAWHP